MNRKNFFAACLSVVVLFSFAACGDGANVISDDQSTNSASVEEFSSDSGSEDNGKENENHDDGGNQEKAEQKEGTELPGMKQNEETSSEKSIPNVRQNNGIAPEKTENGNASEKGNTVPVSQTEPETNADSSNESSSKSNDESVGGSAKKEASKAEAQKFIGKSASSMIAAIGAPGSRSYASSCLGEGEDGELQYNGFTVYTYREGSNEEVIDVE